MNHEWKLIRKSQMQIFLSSLMEKQHVLSGRKKSCGKENEKDMLGMHASLIN